MIQRREDSYSVPNFDFIRRCMAEPNTNSSIDENAIQDKHSVMGVKQLIWIYPGKDAFRVYSVSLPNFFLI